MNASAANASAPFCTEAQGRKSAPTRKARQAAASRVHGQRRSTPYHLGAIRSAAALAVATLAMARPLTTIESVER